MKVIPETRRVHFGTFDDTKGIIRGRQSKKNNQYNDQNEQGQQDKTMVHITLTRATRTLLGPGWFNELGSWIT